MKLYTLTENTDKAREITDQLIAASPNDPVYQGLRLSQSMDQQLDYKTGKKIPRPKLSRLPPEAQLWYVAQYALRFYERGRRADAVKLLDEFEPAKVTDLNTGSMLVSAYAQMGTA